jgi:hypothetical protein
MRARDWKYALRGTVIALAAVVMALAGCAPAATTAAPKVTHFPVQLEREEVLLTGLLQGTLGVREGYLAVDEKVILWPYGFTLDTSGDAPRVLDESGSEVGGPGDTVRLGGGFIGTDEAEAKTGLDLPDWPDETCWLTGGVGVSQ